MEQIGWDGRPRPAAQRRRVDAGLAAGARTLRPTPTPIRPCRGRSDSDRPARVLKSSIEISGECDERCVRRPAGGLRLVTGQGRYTADWDLPGQAYGHFLRADRAHAEIVSLDTSEAAASPGVLAVFTGEDLERAGFKSPRPLMFFKGKNGTELKNPHRPALAHGRIRFVGEAVALVIAETETQAQDAAEKLIVEYRDLPAMVDPRDALAPQAPVLHADAPGNLAMDYEYGNQAATDEAFAKAH